MNDIALDFQSILSWPPESVFSLRLPTVLDGHDTVLLKRIVYRALYHLKTTRQRSEEAINLALEDIFKIYDWFFQQEIDQMIKESKAKLEETDPTLAAYTNFDEYREKAIEATEMHYLGYVDVLKEAAAYTEKFLSETPCDLCSDNFTNAEFFCVLALYKASTALKKLQRVDPKLGANDVDRPTLWEFRRAANATLEAQRAIDLADFYDQLVSVTFQQTLQAANAFQQCQRSLQGNEARWSKSRERREKAWQLYQEAKKANPGLNKTKLIAHIVDDVQEFSDEIGTSRLKVGSELQTIYDWFYKYYPDEFEVNNKKRKKPLN